MKFLERWIPYDNVSHQWPQIATICVVCISSFTQGLLLNWTSPSIPLLISNASQIEPMTLEEASYTTVLPPIGAILTGPVFVVLVDKFGRKILVWLMAIPQIMSLLLVALAEDSIAIHISRFIAGVGDAVHYNSVPLYVGEISDPEVRGLWGNLIAINIYFGGFVINVIGAYFNLKTTAYISLSIPTLQLLLIGFFPESPYFLLMKGRVEEARASIKMLKWKENVDDDLQSLTKDVQRQISESGTLKDLFCIPTNRKALLVAIGIRAAQELSGLAAFTLYTQYLFDQVGGNVSAATSAIAVSGTLAVTISIVAFVVDKFGRRPLMIFSSFGCGIAVTIEAIYFFIVQETKIDISSLTWIPLAAMLLYIVICSCGLGILPPLMLGELLSASIKAKASYIVNIFFALCLLSISKVFQILSYNFGMYVPFCLFAFFCYASVVFSYYCVPETKGKTLEEIQQGFRGGKSKKQLSS